MFLKCNSRFKNGKDHHYWSLVENRRCAGGKVVQRPVLYLGGINDSQKAAWIKTIKVFDEDQECSSQVALFAADQLVPAHVAQGVQVCLDQFQVRHPRRWGACWLACDLWSQLQLDQFWGERLPPSREGSLVKEPWHQARPQVRVKLLEQEVPPVSEAKTPSTPPADPPKKQTEVYVYVESQDRVSKERSMRRRRLKRLWIRLRELNAMKPLRDELLMKLGAARKEAGRAWYLVKIKTPKAGQPVTAETFQFHWQRAKLRLTRQREGRYLLRSHLTETDPAHLWQMYLLLAEVEAAFKSLKTDLHLRPNYHHKDGRIEAHIFVAFMAYCMHVTLKGRLRGLAPGLTPRAVLDKMAALQMVDVHFPTTDGRELIFSHYTQPEKGHQILLSQMKLQLPEQAPPRITTHGKVVQNN